MPTRVTTRTSAPSHPSTKSSRQPLDSRRAPTSSLDVVSEDGPTTSLRSRICSVFGDAQKSTAGHRKLVVGLRKIQEACIYEPRPSEDDGECFGEDDFNVEIARCVIRIMGVKKGEGIGDRLVRFVGLFLNHASEKDALLVSDANVDETQSLPDTATSRLTSHILSMLLQFLSSKEKTVRYRSTQIVQHIVNALDSIDDEYYHLLKNGLLRRIRDKEPMIRVQAVLGLGRLAGNEEDDNENDEDSDDEDASGLLERLVDVLQNDPSAEVRRSLLLNLPLTPITLPYLLERARDCDPATRRVLYSRLLPALGDFRHLSLSMRDKLLRWGLRDRDQNVRKATARLFRERWIQDCANVRGSSDDQQPMATARPNVDGLLELLERIDIINSGVEGGVAAEAMKEFWDGRPDYHDEVRFDDSFWDTLTPESAFMARSMNDFYRQEFESKFEAFLEEKMPEVTKLAFFLEKYLNDLLSILHKNDTDGNENAEETVEQEFVVEQLLHIAKTLDYSDEVGRRKMFTLLRETLAVAEMPDEITKLVIEILRDLCGNETSDERVFCSVVLEAVAEVHDAIAADQPLENAEDESFHSALSAQASGDMPTKAKGSRDLDGSRADDQQEEEKAIRELMINMKCLHIAQCMLQNVEDQLHANVHLVTMLNNLVVPAVRSHEAPIRERGLLCLGLCCLLDKNLADENLTLFLHCFCKGHDALQVTAIHILADILSAHPNLVSSHNDHLNFQKSIFKAFTKGMKADHAPAVQSAVTVALCKLMLTCVIQNEELLQQAVICYFDPGTKSNGAVRQALSYFLPVYCHSRRENMERMALVAGAVIQALVDIGEELDERDEMVGISIVGNMLVDWTDARKLVVQDEASPTWDETGKKEIKITDGDVHLILAESVLERALNHGCSKEHRKALIGVLGKLYVTSNSDTVKLRMVETLVTEAIENKIAADSGSRSALNKLQAALSKAMGEATKERKLLNDLVAPVVEDGLTILEDSDDSVGDPGADIKVEVGQEEESTEARDSVLDELLEDEEDLE